MISKNMTPFAADTSLADTILSLEKKFGKGVVMRLNDQQTSRIPSQSTGSLKLDIALGVGGLPYGRIIEIYGPEASGKSSLALHSIAEAQKKGGTAVLIDSEHAFDRNYAKVIGVDIQNLLIAQPDYGEQALEIAQQLIASGKVQIVVIDSVAALVPKSELEGEIGSCGGIGAQARLMSQALRKLTGQIHKSNAICIFINQLRHKIGVLFGSPEVTSGGNALKYYASIRIDVRRGSAIKLTGEEVVIGHHIKCKIVKNKVAPPFKTTEVPLIYGKGFAKRNEIIDLAVHLGFLKKAGTWFSYKGSNLGQGKEKLESLLASDKELTSNLEKEIFAAIAK